MGLLVVARAEPAGDDDGQERHDRDGQSDLDVRGTLGHMGHWAGHWGQPPDCCQGPPRLEQAGPETDNSGRCLWFRRGSADFFQAA